MTILGTEYYDLINACLNIGGAIAISTSIYRVLRDKMVRGVHWGMLSFFITWSTWNLVLYTHVGLWYSFLAGILMVLTEATYLFLLIFYSKQEQQDSFSAYLEDIGAYIPPKIRAKFRAKKVKKSS